MGAWYSRNLQQSPITTKLLTAFCLASTSNAFANALAGKFNPLANLKYGLTCSPPFTHFWFLLLDKITHNTILKLLLDQLLWRPFLMAYIFISDGKLNGESNKKIQYKMTNIYPTVVWNGLKVWPAVQAINMTMTPPVFQSVVLDLVSFVMDIYTSSMLMTKDDEEEEEKNLQVVDEEKEDLVKAAPEEMSLVEKQVPKRPKRKNKKKKKKKRKQDPNQDF